MFFRPTIQVELEQEDSKTVKEIYIRGDDPPSPLITLSITAPYWLTEVHTRLLPGLR